MIQTLEDNAGVIPFPAGEEAVPATQGEKGGSYDAVRFNAMKHGILSRCTVLSHEDADEYRALLLALTAEHQPAGATEAYLVEELAGIIWRKRRVLLAEGANINQGIEGRGEERRRRHTGSGPIRVWAFWEVQRPSRPGDDVAGGCRRAAARCAA